MPTVEESRSFSERAVTRPEALVNKWSTIGALFDGLPDGGRILECGAGTGLYTLPLLQAGYHVVAVDLSANRLQALVEQAEMCDLAGRLTTFCGDFNEMVREADGQFDAVSFIKVLHHFDGRPAIEQAIHTAYRLLRAGGRLIGFEPNGNCPLWYVRFRVLDGKERWNNEKNLLLTRRNFFDSIFSKLSDASWTFRYHHFIPTVFASRLPPLSSLDRLLCRTPYVQKVSGFLSFRLDKQPAQPATGHNGATSPERP